MEQLHVLTDFWVHLCYLLFETEIYSVCFLETHKERMSFRNLLHGDAF